MSKPIKGFDVSRYQDPARVPWAELKRAGYTWCYIRAHNGTKPDWRFRPHVARAQEHGFLWGPYLYMEEESELSPLVQVDHFYQEVEDTGYDLWPCLDVEDPNPHPIYLEQSHRGAELAKELLGQVAIYSGAEYFHAHLAGWAVEYPLWIADYDGAINRFPRPDGRMPEARQITGEGFVGGYGPLDLNVAHDLDAFRIEPRAVEVVGDRVPELVRYARNLAQAAGMTHVPWAVRQGHAEELRKISEQLCDVIEQDAEAARGGS